MDVLLAGQERQNGGRLERQRRRDCVQRQPAGLSAEQTRLRELRAHARVALAGRDEPRDLVDTLHVHQNVLPLGPLVWAAVGKDPGFSPLSLLEMLRRRGKVRPEELRKLHLAHALDAPRLKSQWLEALEGADAFVRTRPPDEVGCLYYSAECNDFVDPDREDVRDAVPHHGRPGGVLPRILPSEDGPGSPGD